MAVIDEREIDELFERAAQRLGRVEAGVVGAKTAHARQESPEIRLEESRDAVVSVVQ